MHRYMHSDMHACMATWMDMKVHSGSAVRGTNSANNDGETFDDTPELPKDSDDRQDSTVLLPSFAHCLVNISTPLPLS